MEFHQVEPYIKHCFNMKLSSLLMQFGFPNKIFGAIDDPVSVWAFLEIPLLNMVHLICFLNFIYRPSEDRISHR